MGLLAGAEVFGAEAVEGFGADVEILGYVFGRDNLHDFRACGHETDEPAVCVGLTEVDVTAFKGIQLLGEHVLHPHQQVVVLPEELVEIGKRYAVDLRYRHRYAREERRLLGIVRLHRHERVTVMAETDRILCAVVVESHAENPVGHKEKGFAPFSLLHDKLPFLNLEEPALLPEGCGGARGNIMVKFKNISQLHCRG